MMNFNFNWWQTILIIVSIIIINIVCFPVFVLQRIGFKCKLLSNVIYKIGLDQVTYYDIYIYKK
jgi:hypothetical protein